LALASHSSISRKHLIKLVPVFTSALISLGINLSLHSKILKFSDKTLVYPAQGAGSICGKVLSNEAVSTLGEQRQRLYNYALQPMTKEDFIKLVSADQPEASAYFGYDATLNQQERPNLDDSMKKSMKALNLKTIFFYKNLELRLLIFVTRRILLGHIYAIR